MGLFSALLRSSQKLSFDCWPHQCASTLMLWIQINKAIWNDLQSLAIVCNCLQHYLQLSRNNRTPLYTSVHTRERKREIFGNIERQRAKYEKKMKNDRTRRNNTDFISYRPVDTRICHSMSFRSDSVQWMVRDGVNQCKCYRCLPHNTKITFLP